MEQFLKIRDKKSGLYSSGGTNPSWHKRGKVWRLRNHVLSHLAQFSSGDNYYKEFYSNSEVVMFAVKTQEVLTMDVLTIILANDERKQREAEAFEAARRKHAYEKAKQIVDTFEQTTDE